MTNINLEVGELKRISSRSEDINSEVRSTLGKINGTLNDISSIITSNYLTSGNQRIAETIGIISRNINNSLTGIKAFLDDQVVKYENSVEQALEALTRLIQMLDSSFSTIDTSVYHDNIAAGFKVTTDNQKYETTDEEFDTICAIVAAESDQTYDDSLGVVSTILNRCESDRWIASNGSRPISQATAPNQYVVYQEGIYKKYLNGKAPETVKTAVRDALNGVRNHEYFSFRSNGSKSYSDNMITSTGNRYA